MNQAKSQDLIKFYSAFSPVDYLRLSATFIIPGRRVQKQITHDPYHLGAQYLKFHSRVNAKIKAYCKEKKKKKTALGASA